MVISLTQNRTIKRFSFPILIILKYSAFFPIFYHFLQTLKVYFSLKSNKSDFFFDAREPIGTQEGADHIPHCSTRRLAELEGVPVVVEGGEGRGHPQPFRRTVTSYGAMKEHSDSSL